MNSRTYSEPCQTSKMERFAKVVIGKSCQIFSQNVLCYRVQNTPMNGMNFLDVMKLFITAIPYSIRE